jgi:crotonobetainyl-CoA:carnitine CoA-transferase CaiB-like acyl-CoA transferase
MSLPLEGIRVLDFTWIVAGPTGTRLLADFGAEVIRVETQQSLDPIRLSGPFADRTAGINRSGHFNNINRNKKSIALNLHHPVGLEVARRLVAVSDMVTENFTPGTLAAWGLSYEEMRRLRPDIIYCAVSGYGPGGRNSGYTSWGPTAQAVSGLTMMSGLPGHEPAGWGYSHLDLMPGYLMAAAALMALYHRQRTGQGQYIDISQVEVGIFLAAPRILDYTVNAHPYAGPNGNRSEFLRVAPHNTYLCHGEDRWVAIVCRSDAEWLALAMAMDRPELVRDGRFASNEARLRGEDQLDDIIEEWTSGLEPHRVMEVLQAAGVPCGAVQDARDKVEHDPQLRARGFFQRAEHTEVGERIFEGPVPGLSRTSGRVERGAPLLGEHTEHVLREVLGMDDAEVAEVTASGACQ